MKVRLPLPRFTRSPIFFLGLAALHVYLGGGHLLALFDSAVTSMALWKGVGATAGAYYFMALWLRAREGRFVTKPVAQAVRSRKQPLAHAAFGSSLSEPRGAATRESGREARETPSTRCR